MLAFFAHDVTPRIIINPPYCSHLFHSLRCLVGCRLFRLWQGASSATCLVSSNDIVILRSRWWIPFFFTIHRIYIYIYTHMYLLVVLLLCCCLGLWWLHCSFCEVVELWFRASASPPKCSVSVLLWKHGTMCSERRLWWQPRVFSMEESRLELSKRYWIAALGVTFFLVDVVKQPLALYACILSTKI